MTEASTRTPDEQSTKPDPVFTSDLDVVAGPDEVMRYVDLVELIDNAVHYAIGGRHMNAVVIIDTRTWTETVVSVNPLSGDIYSATVDGGEKYDVRQLRDALKAAAR